MSRLWSYAASYGQRYVYTTLSTIGTGSAILTIFPNTVFVDKYKDFFQLYRKSFPLEVTDELNNLLVEVSEELNIPIRNPKVQLFHTIGQHLNRIGLIWSNSPCFIGLPINFSYKSVNDIDEDIMVEGKKVPWESKEGDILKESLILSKRAMKYAIAHELKIGQGPLLYFHSSYPIIIIFNLMFLNNAFVNKIIHSRNPRFYMKLFYISLAVLGIGFNFVLKDCTTKYFELEADEELAKASEDYLLGGIEYLEKQLRMNIALRSLLPDGSSEYTAEGEEIHWIRRKYSPIIDRLRIFKKRLNAEKLKNVQNSFSSDLENS